MVDIPFIDIGDLINRLDGLLTRAFQRMERFVNDAVFRLLNSAGAVVSVVSSSVGRAFDRGVDSVVSVVDSLAGSVADGFDAVVSRFGDIVDSLVAPIVGRITGFVDNVLSGLESFIQPIRNALNRVGEGLSNTVDFLRDFVNTTIQERNQLFAQLAQRTNQVFDRLVNELEISLGELAGEIRESVRLGLAGVADMLTLPLRLLTTALDAVGLGLDDLVVVLADVISEGLAQLTVAVVESTRVDADDLMQTIGELLTIVQSRTAQIGQTLAQEGGIES